MKNIVFSFILVVSFSTLAAENSLLIGGEENSGYENLTCSQMITANLRYQASSKLNENAIAAEFVKCRDHFWKSDREQCVKEIEVREKKYKDMMNAFVNALGIRVQIYDSLSIADKSKLSPECKNISAKSYKRDSKMNDIDFFRKLYLQCKIKTDVEMDARTRVGDLYGKNKEAYKDREVCKTYMYEYSKKMYGDPIKPMPAESKIKVAEDIREARVACQKLSCDTLLKNPTNNPSPCYRNQLLDCMVSGSAGGGSGGSGTSGTGR
ncbi:hypothetical protein K2P97_01040 [bacterium]|nr:hypothetical protein [bacterium]